MKTTDQQGNGGKPARTPERFINTYFSRPYIYLSILFLLLFLFGPAAGFFQHFLQSETPGTDFNEALLEKMSKGWEYQWENRTTTDGQKNTDEMMLPIEKEWKPIVYPLNPPERNGRNLLFLRHTIPAGSWSEPALLIDGRGILLTFRAYVGEQLIHKFGRMNSRGEGRISGISSHIIPLDIQHLGQTLVIHVFSDYSNIGIRGRVYIGSKSSIYQSIVRKDINKLVIGIFMVLIGLLDFFSYRHNIKTTGAIPMFGVLALALGLYTINVTTLKDVILFAPVFWFNLYIVSMTIIPVGAIGFVWQTFRARPGNFLHRLWILHAVYAAVCQLSFLLALYALAPISIGTLLLNILRWLLILEMFMIIGIISWDAFAKKDAQARIYLCGFLPVILAGIHDSLAGLDKIESSSSYVPWAMMVFILSLELIQRRLFIKVQNRLKKYTAQLEIKSVEKEELLRDLHDGIGGLITNIKFISEMGRSSTSIPEMKEALANISEHSSESLIEIGNFMQSLDEDDTDWPILEAKFRQFGEKLLASRGMIFHFSADIVDDIKRPDPVLFLNLLQIYKEALTNATKHAKADSVQVHLSADTANLRLSVQDDGIGFGKSIVHGKGLANMKARAQKIGGALSITSRPGTVVVLELPLKQNHP